MESPEFFGEFSKARIRRDIKLICHSALTARLRMSGSHHVMWPMPGTLLKIMQDNDIAIPKAMFKSFLSFLDISMVRLNAERN